MVWIVCCPPGQRSLIIKVPINEFSENIRFLIVFHECKYEKSLKNKLAYAKKVLYLHPQTPTKALILNNIIMTKADIVAEISNRTGIEKITAQSAVETFMDVVKNAMENGDNVYLRGFGSFIIKHRKQKTGRNISKKVSIVIPAHNIPAFKPAKTFVESVKNGKK